MRKYFMIALGLAIFAITPALARTNHRSATQATQNLRISAIPPSQGATTRAAIVDRLHKSVNAPDVDCVQHSFGVDIGLAC
jgi:ABC-type phosphate/phosphonate transport system substrate-binding protein